MVQDASQGTQDLEISTGIGTVRFPGIDLTVATNGFERFSVRDGDHASPYGQVSWTTRFTRNGWDIKTITKTTLTCDALSFTIKAELNAFENGVLIYEQKWLRNIPRRLV